MSGKISLSVKKKNCVRETLNLSTDADSSTNAKTDRNGIFLIRVPHSFLHIFFAELNIFFGGGISIFLLFLKNLGVILKGFVKN